MSFITDVRIKQEITLDEEYEMQCNEDYSVTTNDLDNYSSSGYTMVTVKSEPTNYDSEETVDADETALNVAAVKLEFPEENIQMEKQPAYSHNSLLRQLKTEEDLNRLIRNRPEILPQYTGIPYAKIFTELLEYIDYAILEIEDTPKSLQLFSVLTKLHTNLDGCFVDPFKFPAIYVSVIDTLYEHLSFMQKMRVTNWEPTDPFKQYFPKNSEVALLSVFQINLKFPNFMNAKCVKYLIGLKCQGQIFYVSKFFKERVQVTSMFQRCNIAKKMHLKTWFIYRVGNKFHRNRVNLYKKPKEMRISPAAHEHFSKMMDIVSNNYFVFNDHFPPYMLRKENGTCFLDKLVYVCCMLNNIIS